MDIKCLDVLYYTGEYENCHRHLYEVVKVWHDLFGRPGWVDLKRLYQPYLDESFFEYGYEDLWSVELYELETVKDYNIKIKLN